MSNKITTQVMGILNVTPDSFSDGGLFQNTEDACIYAEKMVEDGANIIDVGGESTRPGSDPISLQEELDRVMPVLERVVSLKTKVSIDTTKAEVAHEALKLGVKIVNDISGLQFDETIALHVAEYDANLILMHMKGVPKTMQVIPSSKDIIQEIYRFFQRQTQIAINAGIKKENIILDPGIGFGKRLEDNIAILKNLDTFLNLKYPLLIGASRKSMIGDISGAGIVDRLPGSLTIACIAAIRGVRFVRVHNVAETVQALKVLKNIW